MPDTNDGTVNGAGATALDEQNPHAHLKQDSSTTQAEVAKRTVDEQDEAPRKKPRVDISETQTSEQKKSRDTQVGAAPVKAEYLIFEELSTVDRHVVDDDAAEGRHQTEQDKDRGSKKRQKNRGQNKARDFGVFGEARGLCSSRAFNPEFSPENCRRGERCTYEHDLRKYLNEYKRKDLEIFDKKCPSFELKGRCSLGFKCRFLGSHMEEVTLDDGRKELRLLEKPDRSTPEAEYEDVGCNIVNEVRLATKIELQKRRYPMPKSEFYLKWLEEIKGDQSESVHKFDNRAAYVEGALRPSEKRKLYFGRDTPALAPLTTQGNLPYRRLCVELGAQFTYSEMAMSVPLINGHKPEWALMKAHESETQSPSYGASPQNIVQDYDNTRDLKFAAQISGNKPWNITKATEVLTSLCPHLRLVDVNCGCPIDLVFNHGAGSALLDYPGKLEKMLMGMNAVSGEVPITCKIRMGTKDKEPTALKLVNRLVFGAQSDYEDPAPVDLDGKTSGVAAITLHGRSRQQRYSRSADWTYIADCASVIKHYNRRADEIADTIREPEARDQPANGKVFFLGNGDCYSHVDYYKHLDQAGVDSVMIARGALVKPWLFEEIEKGQYLDKSATERLNYVEKFVKYGFETWGTDEIGISTTRRFLLEWLSFAHRYIPIGLLEHLPPSLQDRAPRYKGRNELETLFASDNYKDWIKISEMFLGPASDGFKFQPKHKSNSYDYNAEG